jgi:hypothetical protein
VSVSTDTSAPMPYSGRPCASGADSADGGVSRLQFTGCAVSSNHSPVPLLPAGNTTSRRGFVDERTSRWAATWSCR